MPSVLIAPSSWLGVGSSGRSGRAGGRLPPTLAGSGVSGGSGLTDSCVAILLSLMFERPERGHWNTQALRLEPEFRLLTRARLDDRGEAHKMPESAMRRGTKIVILAIAAATIVFSVLRFRRGPSGAS